jgi:hypothetical protein
MEGIIPVHPEDLDCEMTIPCPSCNGEGGEYLEVES